MPEMIRKGEVASILRNADLADIARLLHIVVTQSRVQIPILFGFDAIQRYGTIFPIPLAMAESFDTKLEEQDAAIAAVQGTAAP